MTGKGRQDKGARYERSIVKAIREVCGLDAEQCWRTPLSGGHYAEASGDIQFAPRVRDLLPVSIECKHHAGVKLDGLLSLGCPNAPWLDWLHQTEKAAAKDGLEPLLIARVNRRDYAIGPDYGFAGKNLLSLRFMFNDRPWECTHLIFALNNMRRKVRPLHRGY